MTFASRILPLACPLLCLVSLVQTEAALPGSWVKPDYPGVQKTSVRQLGSSINLDGIVRAGNIEIQTREPSLANFDYQAVASVPAKPATWASSSLVVYGLKNDRQIQAMILFRNDKGKAEAGFYPGRMVPVSLQPGKPVRMRVQAVDGEMRFRFWQDGTPEPEKWTVTDSIPEDEILTGVGLRTFAHQGEFKSAVFNEGTVPGPAVIPLEKNGTLVTIREDNGTIHSLKFGDRRIEMFRKNLAGPALYLSGDGKQRHPIRLTSSTPAGHTQTARFEGAEGPVSYSFEYTPLDGAVELLIKATNTSSEIVTPDSLSLQLGIDTLMISYPQWDTRHFPTFLRNEPTHFLGYAMSPEGSILGIFSPDRIPSWHLNYNNGGHRINGINLDLLTATRQPERIGNTTASIAPGETRQWRIRLLPVASLKDFPQQAAIHTAAPVITADRYTGEPGEAIRLSLFGNPETVTVTAPDGTTQNLPPNGSSIDYTLPDQPGFYHLTAQKKVNGETRTATASLTVRQPWSWYMLKAREWVVKAKQKGGSHTEGWYGFFPAFKIRHEFPDEKLDRQVDANFDEIFPTMYDLDKVIPLRPAYPNRIQNHACAASLYAERYLITKNIRDLEIAADLCDFVIKTQTPDGAYRSHGTHYTSVIYIAKSIMEVMRVEYELGKTEPKWKKRFNKHYNSVEKAIDELALNLDDIQTEGEMTFEDGMISCSYTQIAAWARHYAKPENRQKYITAAEKLVAKHRCLSQLFQPDSRMNGSSLRFWESQYDVLWAKNLMSSPHGWSAWRLYGLFDLYRLTGKLEYLRQAMEGMGTCANLIHPQTGELSWAFMVDPSITTDVLEPESGNPQGKYVRRTLGECYVPMVSQWLKAPYGKAVFCYRRSEGGTCDNDVHEIYKCLAEHALTTTWLYIDAEGKPQVWNGKIQSQGDTLIVTPSESIVREIHVNTETPVKIRINRPGSDREHSLPAGMTSLSL